MASIADVQAALNAVNARFVWQADEAVWFRTDHWETPLDAVLKTDSHGIVHGDCDQHAELCRQVLRFMGVPNRLVYCRLGDAGHLVCEAEVDGEWGWILDCNTPRVTQRELLPYTFISRSGLLAGDPWHEIIG